MGLKSEYTKNYGSQDENTRSQFRPQINFYLFFFQTPSSLSIIFLLSQKSRLYFLFLFLILSQLLQTLQNTLINPPPFLRTTSNLKIPLDYYFITILPAPAFPYLRPYSFFPLPEVPPVAF